MAALYDLKMFDLFIISGQEWAVFDTYTCTFKVLNYTILSVLFSDIHIFKFTHFYNRQYADIDESGHKCMTFYKYNMRYSNNGCS